MPDSVAGAHSMLEVALVSVFLSGLGGILHGSMSVRASLIILLAIVTLADNLRHVFRQFHMI